MNWLDRVKGWFGKDGGEFGGAGTTGGWPTAGLEDAMRAAAPEADRETILRFVVPVDATCAEFEINTPTRLAAFLAQIAHESAGFRYTREIASGEAYEGRIDLGNTEPGDGVRFAGRGLIQLTGRSNYREASLALCGDGRLVLAPQLVERPDLAARISGWYWKSRGLNELADVGHFVAITRRINGGLNGIQDRTARWTRVRSALGVTG